MKLIPQFAESLKDPKRMQEARACYARMSYVLSYSLNKPISLQDIRATIELVINGSKEQRELSYLDMTYRFMTPEQRHEFNELMKKEYNDRYAKIFNIAGIPISELTKFNEDEFPYFKTEKK